MFMNHPFDISVRDSFYSDIPMAEEEAILKSTATRILTDWAMMLLDEPPSTVTFDPEKPLFMSWVNMRGAAVGTLGIVAQSDFIDLLAQNLLDGELSEDQRKDAFKELGNILAGNFFTEAYGEDKVFDLIYPSVVEIEAKDLTRIKERSRIVSFLADGAPVLLSFSYK